MKNTEEVLIALRDIQRAMREIHMNEAFCEIESHEEFTPGDFTLGDAISGIDGTIRAIESVGEFERGRLFYRHGNRIIARNKVALVRRFSPKFRAGYAFQRTQSNYLAQEDREKRDRFRAVTIQKTQGGESHE